MSRFRKTLFWLHLASGLTAGLVIALMAFTGLCMSFQPQILAWADRDAARVVPPAVPTRLPVADLLSRVREDWPDAKPSALTVYADPARAVTIALGRDGLVYANPYTGDSVAPATPRLRAFFEFTLRLHRWLGAEDQAVRKITGHITGAACAVFLGLCVTGLILWWPSQWTARVLRPSLWFVRSAKGKARDWNWHNVFGFWSLPLLIVITITGLFMAYKPLADLLYKAPPTPVITRPEGARPIAPAALIALAQTTVPAWEQITLRLGNPRRETPSRSGQSAPAPSVAPTQPKAPEGPQPATLLIRETGALSPVPRQLVVNPFTGEILRNENLSDYSFARALRQLAKPVHTGEAGGLVGAILGSLATLGALVLVYTGFALSWRRFFMKRDQPKAT